MANKFIGVSPSGKARGFDPRIPRFESWHPSQLLELFSLVLRFGGERE